MKKFSELNKINEGAPNYDYQVKVEKTKAWNNLQKEFGESIAKFMRELEQEIGHEEGDTDDDRAVGLSIQSAVDAHYGY